MLDKKIISDMDSNIEKIMEWYDSTNRDRSIEILKLIEMEKQNKLLLMLINKIK